MADRATLVSYEGEYNEGYLITNDKIYHFTDGKIMRKIPVREHSEGLRSVLEEVAQTIDQGLDDKEGLTLKIHSMEFEQEESR